MSKINSVRNLQILYFSKKNKGIKNLKNGKKKVAWYRHLYILLSRTLDLRKTEPLKNGLVRKSGPQCVKVLPFVSWHMKDNVKVILFHIKSRDVQGLAFVQITFEKCTTNLFFEDGKVSIETTTTNW